MARYQTPLCVGVTKSGARCRNRTTNPDGRCGRCTGEPAGTVAAPPAAAAPGPDPFTGSRPWEGKVVLLTGVIPGFHSSDREWIIASLGGVQAVRPSAAVEVAVAGEGAGPAKLAKFEKLGVPVISLAEFTEAAAGSSAAEVRRWAASYPFATPDALAQMANDPDPTVRARARCHRNYVEAPEDAAIGGLLAD